MNCKSDLQTTLKRGDRSSGKGGAQVYPYWFVQQQRWVEDPLHSDSSVYNLPLTLRIEGPFDHATMDRALTEIVRRHEVLRFSFSISDGQLLQKTASLVPLEIGIVDLNYIEAKQRFTRASEIVRAETLKPFDLSCGLVLRGKLLRLTDGDHILALTTHHLLFDDWSIGVFGREFATLYQAFLLGKPSPLPELTYKYGDFLRWQRKSPRGQALEARISYWRDRLRGGTDFHHLRTDYPRPSNRSNRGRRETEFVSPELTGALRALSQRQGVTLFMMLVAAFKAFLHRQSGDTDIGLGTCAANRDRLEFEGLIGRFANDLVLRTNLSHNPSFLELLKRVRRTALEAYTYQDVPFGSLVEALAPTHYQNRNPLFQVMFILQDVPKDGLDIPELKVSWCDIELMTAKYDLNVWLKIKDTIEVCFEYDADLFEPGSMRHMLDNYRMILERIVVDPNILIAQLPTCANANLASSRQSFELKSRYVAPRSPVEAQLAELWEEAFNTRPIGIHDNFFEMGGGSLLATHLCRRVEWSLGKKLSLACFFQAPTIEGLAGFLTGSSFAGQLVHVVPLQPHGSRPPFFCVCLYVGAGSIFLHLTHHLGPDQPFLGLVPEESLALHLSQPYTMEDIAQHLIVAIRQRQPAGPYFLGGFCGDGVLAFETARLLRAQGEMVSLLALCETQTPEKYFEFQSKGSQLRSIIRRLAFHQMGRHLANLRQREKASDYILNRMDDVVQDLKGLCWQARIDWNLRLNQGRLRQLRQIHFVAEKAYQPRTYEGNVALFRCADYRRTVDEDRYGGWRKFVEGALDLHEIPGDHLGILSEPNVPVLAERLSRCLQAAQSETNSQVSTHIRGCGLASEL